MKQRYISVRDWRRFQHYDPAKRTPPWIKQYTELLHDDSYMSLPVGTALVLHRLWLEYASSRCRLALDTASISRRLGVRVTMQQLKSLNRAGFIDFVASAALADGYHDASLEVETEKRKTPLKSPQGDKSISRKQTRGYTGCKWVRGTNAGDYVYDVLGRDKPPKTWPHGAPSHDEIVAALAAQNGSAEHVPEIAA